MRNQPIHCKLEPVRLFLAQISTLVLGQIPFLEICIYLFTRPGDHYFMMWQMANTSPDVLSDTSWPGIISWSGHQSMIWYTMIWLKRATIIGTSSRFLVVVWHKINAS